MIAHPWAGESVPTPEPAAAPGLPTTGGPVTQPPVPAPPPQTSPRPADRPLTPDDYRTRLTLANLLACAAVDIGRRGHLKAGGAVAADGPRDVLSAISLSAATRGDRHHAVAQVQATTCTALLAQHLGIRPEAVGGWNDDPERTPEQVIDALYATAEEVLLGA